jgi:hypothetical protein
VKDLHDLGFATRQARMGRSGHPRLLVLVGEKFRA